MIEPELELYYRNLRQMFMTEGWKTFIEDVKANAELVNSIEFSKDIEDLYTRKGQLLVMSNILNLENQIDIAEKQQLESEDQWLYCLILNAKTSI